MKRLISVTLLLTSALFVFNLCFFFCVDYDGNERAWICYLFFHLAYILSLLGLFFTTRRRFAVLNSKLYVISTIYLILATLTCILFCTSAGYSTESELFVFLIELLFYILSFHYCYLTNRKAEKGVLKDLKNASKHDNWIAELRLLSKTTDDKETIKTLNSIIDEIRSSPSLSNSSVYDVDREIQSMIKTLKSSYANIQMAELNNFKNQIGIALRKRTEILKSSCLKA